MSTLTPNYGLIKPEPLVDFALVDDINANYDVLDTQVKLKEDLELDHANIEYGLDYIEFEVAPTEALFVDAGQWGSLFDISQSSPIDDATMWLLDIEFSGNQFASEATSLSVRVDRGINHGGTIVLQTEIRGGTGGAPIFESTSRESAVASAITTFTLLPPPYQDGINTQYKMRMSGRGETPNGHLLSFSVSPQGNGGIFGDVIGKLTFGR